jgi:hypothetical protein
MHVLMCIFELGVIYYEHTISNGSCAPRPRATLLNNLTAKWLAVSAENIFVHFSPLATFRSSWFLRCAKEVTLNMRYSKTFMSQIKGIWILHLLGSEQLLCKTRIQNCLLQRQFFMHIFLDNFHILLWDGNHWQSPNKLCSLLTTCLNDMKKSCFCGNRV